MTEEIKRLACACGLCLAPCAAAAVTVPADDPGIRYYGRVDFSDPVNLNTAAIALIVGIANFTVQAGDARFEGIALGTAAALIVYHLMRNIARWRGTSMTAGRSKSRGCAPMARPMPAASSMRLLAARHARWATRA